MAERFGALEFRFRLQVVDGGIVYQQVAATLVLGPWPVRLPRWMAPRIVATEMPSPDHGPGANVRVHVSAPLAGDLLSYTGSIACEEDPP